MAMSKEEQEAASDRIMAKLGSLNKEEKEIYDRSVRRIEDYAAPKDGSRRCNTCGAEFQDLPGKPALEQFSDHQAKHNPSPAEWTEAHQPNPKRPGVCERPFIDVPHRPGCPCEDCKAKRAAK